VVGISNLNKRFLSYAVLLITISVMMDISAIAFAEGSSSSKSNRNDDEPPSLVVDNTPGTVNTGGELTFSANFTDNVSVVAVWVNYTYDSIRFHNSSMNNIFGETWSLTIIVNISATDIDYYFHFNDSANNTNTSATVTIDIIDTIPPVANAGEDKGVPQG